MNEFKRISVEEANAMISANKTVQIADIRDEDSFNQSHIDSAIHLDNSSLPQFIQTAEFDQPLLVYCYHGHSSQSAAHYLVSQGFDEVYSVDGGFEVWRTNLPAK